MINPAEIPQIPGDMAALGAHATAVSGVGTAFPATGSRVHSTFQGLAGVYSAPEDTQLFAATGPVQSVSASVGEDLTAVGTALGNYATEVAGIQARLATLRTQAADFVGSVAGDDDWRSDQGKVDQHNQLLSDVNAAVADFMDAQRRCANAVLSRYSDKRYTAENGDGTVTDSEFGYSKDVFDAALAQGDGLPWGAPEEHDRGFLGDVGAFFGGIGDGAVEFVQGLGGLIGYSDGHWSWSTAGTAWKGLGIFALGVTAPYLVPINDVVGLPGLPKGTLSSTLLNAGKGLIAYDTWKEDKSKAAGKVTFNVVSAILGTKGAGAGLRGAGAAAEASRFATVAKIGSGAVKAGEFITKIPKVSDVVLNTIKKLPGFKLPTITLPHTDIPTTHIDAPRVEVPAGHPPSGASVADGVGGGHALPPGATITNHGVVPGHGFDAPAPTGASGVPVHDGVIGGRPHVETPAPHGADAPTHAAHEPLPAGATITDKGVVPGGHGPLADTGAGVHVDENGVIRPGPHADAPVTAPDGGDTPVTPAPHAAETPVTPAPHGAETPAAPGSHGADAPGRDAQPLPAGATITDKGVVPGGHGPLADTGARLHIDENGVIRPGPHPETPVSPAHSADAPAPAGHEAQPLPAGATITHEGVVPGRGFEPPTTAGGHEVPINDGVIGRPHVDAPTTPAPHGAEVPGPVGAGAGHPLVQDGVIGGGRGIDASAGPGHGMPHGESSGGNPLGHDAVADSRGGVSEHPAPPGTHETPGAHHTGTDGTGGGHDNPGSGHDAPSGDHSGDHSGGADHGPGAGDGPPTSVTSGPQKAALIDQLKSGGTRINEDAVIRIGEDPNGRVVWLEEGGVNPRTGKSAGLLHVMEEHEANFITVGVAPHDIPELVHRAVTEGRYTGYVQGKLPGRPIYEIEFQGKKQFVAVSVGNNGFIVGASPRSPLHPFEGSRVTLDPRVADDPTYRGWGK